MTREQWRKRKFKPTHLSNHHYWEKTEMTDKELWSGAFNACANAVTCVEHQSAVSWANKALDAWKERESKDD